MGTQNNTHKFSSQLGFLLATIGCAVGLGNIWRFPAQVYTYGGGSFLLLYIFFTLLVGYPLVLAKLAWGRRHQTTLDQIYKDYAPWQWLGFFATSMAFLTYAFYVVVAGQVLGYFWEIVFGGLLAQEDFGTYYQQSLESISFHVICTLVILGMTALINIGGVSGGIERCSKVLMPCFMVLLIGLIGYAMTFPGAWEGLKSFWVPRWSDFGTQAFAAFLAALGQSFLSLSIGGSQLVIYGAYVDKKNNLPLSAAVIVISDTLVAILAGCFLFPFLHAQGGLQGANGVDLAFVVLPKVFQQLPGGLGVVVGAIFFLLLAFAAITSCISLLEVPSTYIENRYTLGRGQSILIISMLTLMIGVLCIVDNAVGSSSGGQRLIGTIGDYTVDYGLTLSALCFSLFVGRVWGIPALLREVDPTNQLGKYWAVVLSILFRYVVPLLIGFSLVLGVWGIFS